jgi:3-deoxy-7-phosphoheptulonate synthase
MVFSNSSPGKDVSEDDLTSKIPLVTSQSLNGHVVKVRDACISADNFVVMAGPNTVESEEMMVQTALSVKKSGAHILRGGAFKPLTFPYRSEKYFETGEAGLNWLKTASEISGLPTVSEVTSVNNLEMVASKVDMLQIGTRNMQNFDLLQEAARTRMPILLKRAFGSSLRDWLGAAEYILNEGNDQLVMCERGVVVPHTHRSTSRFLLDLQVIPAFKELSFLPIITDPSHATFWAPWVAPLVLASVAVGADGVMIEVHPDPRNAAVDPLQAISFEEFSSLSKKITATHAAIKNFNANA